MNLKCFLPLLCAAPLALAQSDIDSLEQYALTHAGDADAGRELFRREKITRCLICHKVGTEGGQAGPDLSSIGGKFDRPHLIESLLEPSKQIVEGYRPSAIALTDGRMVTGVIRERSEDSFTLFDVDGRKMAISTADVEERVESDISLMPEGLAKELTPQQFTDLVAYLETLRPEGKPQPGAGITGPISLPDGVEVSVVATNFDGATALEVLPDGRIFVCEQTGSVRVIEDGKLLDEPFVTLPVDSSWERGVIGVTVDPKFPEEPFVYVCWVAKEPYPHHRISRFQANGNVAKHGSEEVLLFGDDQTKMGGKVPSGHQGGAVHFGPDGCLYVGIGEQTAGEPSQDLDTFLGKILRINRDGTIPGDNPFVDRTKDKYRAIWAYGCRNPFTFAFRKDDGRMLINDVGGNFEEINVGKSGANYGWPTVDHGPRENDSPYVGPIHWYPQASIAGGDFHPETGRYFFADFNLAWIHSLDPDNPGDVEEFAVGLRRPVDLRFAPDGSLYVLLRNAWVIDGKFEGGTGSLLKISRSESPQARIGELPDVSPQFSAGSDAQAFGAEDEGQGGSVQLATVIGSSCEFIDRFSTDLVSVGTRLTGYQSSIAWKLPADLASVEAVTGFPARRDFHRRKVGGELAALTHLVASSRRAGIAPPTQGRWKQCHCLFFAQTARIPLVPTGASGPGQAPSGIDDARHIKLTRDAIDESAGDLPAFRIETPSATYYLEKTGAGLSSLIDVDGNDWLSFHPEPGSGAAGEYRGFPNAVHKQSGSYLHPKNEGTQPSDARVVYEGTDRVIIEAVSENKLWACRYDFFADHATFTMTRMPEDRKYWVLYEGTPGGQYDDDDWWMTSAVTTPQPMTRDHDGDIPAPEWIAFGDNDLDRSLLLLHHEDDVHADRFYQMERKMTVFGFGRKGIEKFHDRVPQSFSICLLDTREHAELAQRANELLRETPSRVIAGVWEGEAPAEPLRPQGVQRHSGSAGASPSRNLHHGESPHIDVWYGDRQSFGHRGVPQKWINVLGRVTPSEGVTLTYSLNDARPQPLSSGPNYTRLAHPGDFNVEIHTTDLKPGENVVTIAATDAADRTSRFPVAVIWAPVTSASLPFEINWSETDSINDVAQVVDGLWQLTDDGVRTVEPYYDRVIAFGDESWTDYEVETTVTFHGMRFPGEQDGGRNVIHAAIATRWPGHDLDDRQPHVKWYPLGATSEFMLTDFPDQCRWRILGGADKALHAYEDDHRTIRVETKYGMKHRVTSLADGAAEYRVKLWPADEAEPTDWDLISVEANDEPRGGALILAHYADATFGNVLVQAAD